MSPEKRTEISIQGQTFRLRCPEGEEERLFEAARMVEEKIAELAKTASLADSHRAALMAAFNFAYDLLSREEESFRESPEYKRLQKRLRKLVEKIDSNLSS